MSLTDRSVGEIIIPDLDRVNMCEDVRLDVTGEVPAGTFPVYMLQPDSIEA